MAAAMTKSSNKRAFNVHIKYITVRSTQPSIPPGSVNEDQLQLGRRRQVQFIPLADDVGCAGKTVRYFENACHT